MGYLLLPLCLWSLKGTKNSLIVFLLWFLDGSLRLAHCGLVGLLHYFSFYFLKPHLCLLWYVCLVVEKLREKMKLFWKSYDFPQPNRAFYWFRIGVFCFLMLYCLWGLCICSYMLRNWGKKMKLFWKSHFVLMIFRNQTGYFVDFVLGILFLMLYCLWGLCLCYMLRNWGKKWNFF